MNEERHQEKVQDDPEAGGDVGDHGVDPAQNPGPPGNPEIDPERRERGEENLDRTLPG